MSNNINDRKKKFDYVSMIIINEKNIKCIIDDKWFELNTNKINKKENEIKDIKI